MTDELPDLESSELEATEEERRSAAALARALDGRSDPEVPGPALEAAALLRLSAGSAELGERRRAQIRKQVLAALPRRARRRTWLGVPPWLALALPLASAAAVIFMLSSLRLLEVERREAAPVSAPLAAEAERALVTRPDTFSEGQPAAGAQLDLGASRRVVSGLGEEARHSRTELLTRLADHRLAQLHGEVDAASARGDLARSQRLLTEGLDALGAGLSDDDERLVRQDLFCRLAETALELGQPRAALEWTRRGLDLDGSPTPFLAQLMALGGDAWAALGDDANAAKSYMNALRMHEALLDESLGGR